MYQTIPSIKEKDDFVIQLTTSLFDPSFAPVGIPNIQQFCIFNWYYVIMEDLLLCRFCHMLALKRQGKMIGIGEQFEYIMRDESFIWHSGAI